MFSEKSRYIDLDNIVTTDTRGRSLESGQLRLPAEITGTFLHTLEEGERLDHLAFKYYEDSQKWWHICDANPDFRSPLALTGKEPIVTSRFIVSYNPGPEGGAPPWHNLIKIIRGKTGARDVFLTEEMQLVKGTKEYEGQQVEVNVEKWKSILTITHNQLNLSQDDLEKVIEEEGFEVDEKGSIGRVGKLVVIPPDVVE